MRYLSLVFILIAFSSACCLTGNISILPGLPEVESILDLDELRDDRVRLYSLPGCCWPEDREVEGLLPHRSDEPIYSGLDAMVIDQFRILQNRRFALLTNATGLDQNLEQGLELMLANGIQPQILFEPEHGLYGAMDDIARDGVRRTLKHGIRIVSLYARDRRPRPKYLDGLDLILVDIKNLPVRCYTYISTLSYILEAANRQNIEVMILDRPNPYGFWQAQGSYLNRDYTSFIAEAPVPFLYNLTPAEYALYMQHIRYPRLRLSVVQVSGYERDQVDASLRRAWINPSPNIPSFESALVYPGVVFFEGVNFSLGRGTTRPFIYSGAPYVDSAIVLEHMRRLNLPGVEISEVSFKPNASKFKGQLCHGIQINPIATSFDSLRTGYEYMRIIRNLYPRLFKYSRRKDRRNPVDMLWGGREYRDAIESNLSYDEFKSGWQAEALQFEEMVESYRLY